MEGDSTIFICRDSIVTKGYRSNFITSVRCDSEIWSSTVFYFNFFSRIFMAYFGIVISNSTIFTNINSYQWIIVGVQSIVERTSKGFTMCKKMISLDSIARSIFLSCIVFDTKCMAARSENPYLRLSYRYRYHPSKYISITIDVSGPVFKYQPSIWCLQ